MSDRPTATPENGALAFDRDGFSQSLGAVAAALEARLETLLRPAPAEAGPAVPPRLAAAMKHALLAGGKRFRPFLLVTCAGLFDDARGDAVLAGAAVECLHTYSLVHDDLPAMDDDDLRRGRPTVHRAFDEATAILAGDALLTLSFELLSAPDLHPDPAVRADLVSVLARAAGGAGMVGGQMLDLSAEREPPDAEATAAMQAMKTGALIAASCEMGALIGGAGQDERKLLSEYGHVLGRVFQIADDLLDLESTATDLGKATGKDDARGKATLVAHYGADGARSKIFQLISKGDSLWKTLGGRAAPLGDALRFAAARTS